jgi:hypothetical protein
VIVNNEYFRPYQLISDVGICPRTLYPDVGILVRMAKRERSASIRIMQVMARKKKVSKAPYRKRC